MVLLASTPTWLLQEDVLRAIDSCDDFFRCAGRDCSKDIAVNTKRFPTELERYQCLEMRLKETLGVCDEEICTVRENMHKERWVQDDVIAALFTLAPQLALPRGSAGSSTRSRATVKLQCLGFVRLRSQMPARLRRWSRQVCEGIAQLFPCKLCEAALRDEDTRLCGPREPCARW